MKIFFLTFFGIFTIIALVFHLWLSPIITSAYIIFSLLFCLVLASIWKMLFRSAQNKKTWIIARGFFLCVWGTIGILISSMIFFVFYHNVLYPARLANITLQNNSGQSIVFVKMSHIADSDFFAKKKQSIEKLSENGYNIMIEGVGTGSKESADALDALMGFDFTSRGYGEIAHIFGLAEQDHTLYENISPEKIIHVDISLDEVVNLVGNTQSQTAIFSDGVNMQNYIQTLKYQVENLNDREKFVMEQIIFSLLNFQVKNLDSFFADTQKQLNSVQENFFHVILHERNKPVVNYILKNPTQNMAIVYGALHFNGILEGLRQHDASWNIVDIEPFIPYK